MSRRNATKSYWLGSLTSIILFVWLMLNELTTLPKLFQLDIHLGANPIEQLINLSGQLCLCFLSLSLMISPIIQHFHWPNLFPLRQAAGVTSAIFAIIHSLIFVGLEWQFDWYDIYLEIKQTTYLWIGAIAVMLMVVLLLTSNAISKQYLRHRWQQIHRLVFIIVGLALLHYFLQTRASLLDMSAFLGVFAALIMMRYYKTLLAKYDDLRHRKH